MHPAHITLSVLLVLSGLGPLAGLKYEQPSLVGFSVVSGWFLSLVAVVGAVAMLVFLAVEAYRGRGTAAFRSSWLGLANGIGAVLVAWWMGSGAI